MIHRAGINVMPGIVLYALLIAYGSLFTNAEWEFARNPFDWLAGPLPHAVSRKDLYVNFCAYLPFGFLVARSLIVKCSRTAALAGSLLAGFCLSFTLEALQTFIPPREPAVVDLVANSAGTFAGAVLTLLASMALVPGGTLRRLQERWLLPGRAGSIGAGVLLVWALAQMAPNAMSLHRPGPLKKFSPLLLSLQGSAPFSPVDALAHCCYATGLALVSVMIFRPESRPVRLFALAAVFVLAMRFVMTSGYLTLEETAGYAAGTAAALLLARLPADSLRNAVMVAVAAGFVLFEIKTGQTLQMCGALNWVPFRYHLDNTMPAIGQILEAVWPFGAMSFVWLRSGREGGRRALVYGGAAVFLPVVMLEWLQQYIPGRTADMTTALLALTGWCLPIVLMGTKLKRGDGERSS